MSKIEFLETLSRTLKRELSDSEVAENVRYYENYIEEEIRSGKSEAEVLDGLGDPRLIARTILQVDQQREEEFPYGGRGSVYTEDGDDTFSGDQDGSYEPPFEDRVRVHVFRAKSWLILILVVAVICIIFGTIFTILWKLLPVILIAALIMWIYRRFFS